MNFEKTDKNVYKIKNSDGATYGYIHRYLGRGEFVFHPAQSGVVGADTMRALLAKLDELNQVEVCDA